MSAATTREEIAENINQAFNAMRCMDLAVRIPDPEIRQNISVALCEKFGLPSQKVDTDEGMSRMLTRCRLKEDAFGNRDLRTEVRGFLVGLLTEAVMTLEGIADKAPSVSDAQPQEESVTTDPQAEAGQGDQVVSLDIRRELSQAPRSGAARFVSGPPDLPLFPDMRVDHPEVLHEFLSHLAPPPAHDAGDRQLSAWVSGTPFTASGFAFGFGDLDDRGYERLADVEAELLSSPRNVLERNGHQLSSRPPAAPRKGVQASALMQDMAKRFGETEHSDLDILKVFRDATARTLREVFPEKAAGLEQMGATLRSGPELMPMLRHAWTMEQAWLSEQGDFDEGLEQNVIGSVHPEGRMQAGLIFRRAVFLHMAMGTHMSDALIEAALDMRYAQVIRDQDQECTAHVSAIFDQAVIEDCTRPLDSYRIAKKEMEPAF